jgi:YidC/Oxa1 family membrane protein insertase
MGFLDFIAKPLGQFLFFIYNTVAFQYYGLALIIFTLIIRAAMLPLTVKQYRSTAKMPEVQPQIQEIQKRYKNDKEKLNQELMKVYSENKVNPAGGCAPLLIQMPIFLSLWQVISRPMYFMLSKSQAEIDALLSQIPMAERIPQYNELSIVVYNKLLNMNFLGLNLGLVPHYDLAHLFNNPRSGQYLALLIIPITATITTYLSSKLAMPKTTGKNDTNAAMTNSMMYIAPLMTLIFSFQFPAGLGLYWLTGNLVQIAQQMYINKHVLKKKEVVSK